MTVSQYEMSHSHNEIKFPLPKIWIGFQKLSKNARVTIESNGVRDIVTFFEEICAHKTVSRNRTASSH